MIQPLRPRPEPYPADVASVLARYPQRGGQLLDLFRVFANSRRFLTRGTANLLDRDSPVPIRVRELVILRTCANNNCEYEWGVHVAAFAAHAGLSEVQVAATRLFDADADCWSDEDRHLLRTIDELCATGRMTDSTLAAFRSDWSLEEQLEILALAGNYHTICFVANASELELEPFAARFPGE